MVEMEKKQAKATSPMIHSSAKIAENVEIGPWSVIGENVEIDSGTWIGPHVVIRGPTKIGKNNKIYQFASIGDNPQIVGDWGKNSRLEMGDNNVIREYCTINRGAEIGGGVTRIRNNNLFMAYVHIAHDCQIGNNNIFVNNASLAGHVVVENYAVIGVFAGIHQFCTIGSHSFLGHAAMISKDVLPYLMVVGSTPSVYGLNTVGLKRRGFTPETIRILRQAYSIIFRKNLTTTQALVKLEKLVEKCPEVQLFIDGIKKSTRGILR